VLRHMLNDYVRTMRMMLTGQACTLSVLVRI